MRLLTLLSLALMLPQAYAQTVASIADGDWDDPATWDCACVPLAPADVEVLHHLTSAQIGWFQLDMNLHVFTGGSLDLSISSYVEANTPSFKTIDPGGEILVRHTVLQNAMINGALTGSEIISLGSGVTIGGSVSAPRVANGANVLLNNGSIHAFMGFTMVGGSLTGTGRVCASDSIGLYSSSVSGAIDLCDLSATAIVPPYVSICYNCVVAPTVTYCSGSSCMASVQDVSSTVSLSVYPNPAHDQVTFEGMPAGAELKLYDGLGQMVLAPGVVTGTRIIVELGGLPMGIYLATATKGALRLTTRLVVE